MDVLPPGSLMSGPAKSGGPGVPLSADNFVQENSGTMGSTSTSIVVSLPSETTARNTLVVMIGTTTSITTPATGFSTARTQGTNLWAYYKVDVGAGETSWTFTLGVAGVGTWYVAELSNVDLADPYDGGAGASPTGLVDGSPVSTGTTGLNAGLSTVAFAMFTVPENVGDTVSWGGYTNGFEEVADVSVTIGTAGYHGLAVARKFIEGTTGTFECTATLATTNGSPVTGKAQIVLFRAADSPVVAPLGLFAGFGWGTHGGMGSGGANSLMGYLLGGTGTWGTNYLIQAGSARFGNYGLRVVSSASSAYVPMGGQATGLNTGATTIGFDVKAVSASGTVVAAEVNSTSGTGNVLYLLYDASASKFGLRWGTGGTPSWQSGTTPAGTWAWVDIRQRTNSATWHADWRIETAADTYTDQASPADPTSQSSTVVFSTLRLGGSSTSQTATFDFANVCISKYYAAYPLGPHQVKLLTVDPAGTPSVSGTTANFSVFTANGTLAAWNATNARNAVDEVPPTISASADGVAQTVTAAADYVEFPMATYTLGSTEFVNGVRMLAAIGSGTGAGAGDVAIRGYDGTTETALATVSQLTPGSPTAISSTVPLWRCAMWQSTNGWTQAELNAAATRFGYSGDATPDMWLHAIYLEAAVGKTRPQTVIGEAGSIEATAEYDPTRAALVSATVDTPAGRGATMRWVDSGGPGSQVIGAGSSHTRQFNAADSAEVSMLEVESDPEDPDRP